MARPRTRYRNEVKGRLSDLLADIVSRLALDGPNSRDTAAYLLAGFIGMAAEIRYPGHQVLADIGAKAREAYWIGLHEAAERIRSQANES